VTPLPEINLVPLAPMAFVAVGAMAVLLGEVLLTRAGLKAGRIGDLLALVAIGSLALALYTAFASFAAGGSEVFNLARPLYQLDPFSSFVTALIALASLLSCALAIYYLQEVQINHGEFYALVLLATCGMMLMVAAIDLLAVFVGLELMSIPIYVLAGFDRRKLRSNESAMKYFLIGSFASAILLYGMALLYGAAGSTSLAAIRAGFDPQSPLALAGMGLVVVGFAFKVSSVPFHQWTPDVYEGAPAAVTAFMSVTVKTAAFAALMRVAMLGFGPAAMEGPLQDVLWVLAALTMVVGNAMAVIQDNVKRLLAYSSIAHAGYVLVGLVTGTAEGTSAMLFYLVAYVFMNLGAFAVVVALAQRGSDCERLDAFAGLARTRPVLAALMTLFLLSLAGIPGTVGFIAKLSVLLAAVKSGHIVLSIVLVLTSVVSIYYYLRIPVLMYMREPADEAPRMELASGEGFVLGLCALAVVVLGLLPNQAWLPIVGPMPVLDWARHSVALLFAS
jgi:NADH-quinone oxidoreductase subunit N